MKTNFVRLTAMLAFLAMLSFQSWAQNLGAIDGTTEIQMNSTTGSPHLRLVENDVSVGGSCRIEFKHTSASHKFELRSFNASSQRRWSLYSNNTPVFTYNDALSGFGIGTTAPEEKLHVKTSGFDGIKIEGDGTGDARLWIDNQNGNHFIFDDASDDNTLVVSSANAYQINTGGSVRMKLTEAGQWAINGNTEIGRLIKVETDDQLYVMHCENDNTSTAVGIQGEVISTGATNKFATRGVATGASGTAIVAGIYGSASTTPTNSYGVYCAGDIHYTGSMSSGSDARLKKNIKPMTNSLDKVMALAPKSYEFNHEKYAGMHLPQGVQFGFIAQEVREILPSLVEETKQANVNNLDQNIDLLSLKYMELIPVLTQAMQEQQAIIDQQAAYIERIENRQAELEHRISTMENKK